jgi:hypothetical protein
VEFILKASREFNKWTVFFNGFIMENDFVFIAPKCMNLEKI